MDFFSSKNELIFVLKKGFFEQLCTAIFLSELTKWSTWINLICNLFRTRLYIWFYDCNFFSVTTHTNFHRIFSLNKNDIWAKDDAIIGNISTETLQLETTKLGKFDLISMEISSTNRGAQRSLELPHRSVAGERHATVQAATCQRGAQLPMEDGAMALWCCRRSAAVHVMPARRLSLQPLRHLGQKCRAARRFQRRSPRHRFTIVEDSQ